MVMLKGRAITPVRPGLVVKHVLTGKIPLLPSGEIVSESSIVDLHRTYKELISMENASRPKSKQLRGMTYRSFLTLFKFSQLLGLVTFVREEPMQFPPPGGNLLSIRMPNEIVVSVRRIFKISPLGAEDEMSWMNLCRAWRESWPAPQKVEYALPYRPPPEKVAPPPVVEEKPWAPFRRVTRATSRQINLLVKHVAKLVDVGVKAPGVEHELERLASMMVDWSVEAEDAADRATNPKAAKYHSELKKLCDSAEAVFIARDLKKAQSIIAKMKELKEKK